MQIKSFRNDDAKTAIEFELGDRVYYLGVPMVIASVTKEYVTVHYFGSDLTFRTVTFPTNQWKALYEETTRHAQELARLK